MTRIITAIAALILACIPAHAEWPHDSFDTYHSAPRKPVHVHRHKPKTKVIYRTITKPASLTPGPLNSAPQCQPAFRSVGDQAPNFSAAKSAAEKAWSQQARFSFGERYADPANARDLRFECVKSGTGALTGDWFNRCEMYARPCQAQQVGE